MKSISRLADRRAIDLLNTAFRASERGRSGIAVRALRAARGRGLDACLDARVIRILEIEFRYPDIQRLAGLARMIDDGWRVDAGAGRPLRLDRPRVPIASAVGSPPRAMAGAMALRVRTWARRHRDLLAGAPLLFALASTRGQWEHDGLVWTLGGLLALSGLGLRAWASLQSRETRASAGLGLLGDPVQAGNLLLIAAATVASELIWFLPIALGWALLVYARTGRLDATRSDATRSPDRRRPQRLLGALASWATTWRRWMSQPLPAGFFRAALAQAHCALLLLPFMVKEWNLFHLWPGS